MERKEILLDKKKNGICYECDKPAEPNRVRCKKHLKSNTKNVIKYKGTKNGKEIWRKIDANSQKRRRRGVARYSYVKGHVKRKGKEWKLSRDQYYKVINEPCYYCGLPNDVEAGRGLDRLDNNKGYVIKNVVSCCILCNYARGDRLTVEEMKILGKTIRKIKLKRMKELIEVDK